MDFTNKSIVQWFEGREGHRCGYCKNPSGSLSYGMWADELTVEDYQEMIDRGWRRSGKYCYKPIMDKTCCPQYTIKCDTINFQLSKSHKKIIKKFNKFLVDGVINKSDVPSEGQDVEKGHEIPIFNKKDCGVFNKNQIKQNSCGTGEPHPHSTTTTENIEKCEKYQGSFDPKPSSSFKSGAGADITKPHCKKAKFLRLERKKAKMLAKGMDFEPTKKETKQKSLKEFLEDVPDTAKHKLKLKLVPTNKIESNDRIKKVELELYEKYQMTVHDDTRATMTGFVRFLVTSPLKITLHKMSRDDQLFKPSVELYKKYQMIVHNDTEDECEPTQFEDFLVLTPLKPKPFPHGAGGPGYGSFHQQYWIDDKLVAVGVIDVLPKCISSVYFFYDPDYRSLTLGTYGSLREVYFTKCLQEKVPELRFYYMGFYIHSCPKMRYKGKLSPSYLACPESFEWVSIDKCIPKLDVNKYSRLSENLDAVDKNECTPKDLEKIKIVDSYVLYNYKDYISCNKEAKSQFDLIGKLIGKKCAPSMIFWVK